MISLKYLKKGSWFLEKLKNILKKLKKGVDKKAPRAYN